MPGSVVGRAQEVGSIKRWLERLGEDPRILVLEGDAGIGKTTLLRYAVELARGRGVRVLLCAGDASEARLSYAALTDLLAPVSDAELDTLPAAQRVALGRALLRTQAGTGDADRRAVAAGALSLLAASGAAGPTLAVVDDLQWLDRASGRVLEFLARRLPAGVGLLVARRPGTAAWTERLAGASGDGRVVLCPLGPLDDAAVDALVRERVPGLAGAERSALLRLNAVAAGNPFYALELARALPSAAATGRSLPLPVSLAEVVRAHTGSLDGAVQDLLLAVAALSDASWEVVQRALGADVRERVARAEERGVLELVGERLRFTHPLLRHGVYAGATESRRRAMHARLAAVVADPEERARHLALGRVVPAALPALERAGRCARARGAPDAAAELLELALALGGDRTLLVRAAEHHYDAGESRAAQALLEEARSALPAGPQRAEALLLLAEIRYTDDSFPEARTLLDLAVGEAGEDPCLRAMIDIRRAFTSFNLGEVEEAAAAARQAIIWARRLGHSGLLAQALAASVIIDLTLGRGVDGRRLRAALAREDAELRTGGEFHPSLIAAFVHLWTDRLDEARTLLERVCGRFADHGEEHALAWASFVRVGLECHAGRREEAAAAAEAASERLLLLETTNARALAATASGQVAALTGEVDAARRACREATRLFAQSGWSSWSAVPLATLGFLELSIGVPAAAAAVLEPLTAQALLTGLPEPAPGGMRFAGDAAEALVALGRLDQAAALACALEARGRALDRPWAIAVGARCRGVLLAAQGDLDAAERALQDALLVRSRLPMPLEHGRTLLWIGRVRRRARRRRAARAALLEAEAIFAWVGSPRWRDRAAEEIACLGDRPGGSEALTPSEERVARLTASGLTNRQVAAQLHLSPKTVETHLAHAYGKLGIRSRAELGARLGAAARPEIAQGTLRSVRMPPIVPR